MEVIEGYEMPDCWEAKGMNWNDPDPTNVDYVMAIRQALFERFAALHIYRDERLYKISPFRTVSRDVVKGIVKTIVAISDYFVDLDCEDFKEDWSDFPKKLTYERIVNDSDRRLFAFSQYGSLTQHGGSWLRAIKNAIDRLTVIQAGEVYGRVLTRSGADHDPPFDESIGTAMQLANENAMEGVLNGSFPKSVYAWSGNTHWKCPDPDYKGEHPERDNVDGYCGYAENRAYRITAARNWLKGAEFDIFAAVIATEPTDPAMYSVQLDASVFDGGDSGFRKGLNWTRKVHVKDPYDFTFVLGDPETIPKNEVVPESEFDEKGYAVRRHSTKRGWIGASYGFLDYGVEGGFKFRSKEG